MEKFRANTSIPMAGGLGIYEAGAELTREQLSHADLHWLHSSGAISPAGGVAPVSLLPDHPTEGQFRDEVQRLQTDIEALWAENDRLNALLLQVKSVQAGNEESVNAANNVARKLTEAEAGRTKAEALVRQLQQELANARRTSPATPPTAKPPAPKAMPLPPRPAPRPPTPPAPTPATPPTEDNDMGSASHP